LRARSESERFAALRAGLPTVLDVEADRIRVLDVGDTPAGVAVDLAAAVAELVDRLDGERY
jgi:hypothetical protein